MCAQQILAKPTTAITLRTQAQRGVITLVECGWQTANSGRTLFTDKSSVRGNGRQNTVLPHGTTGKAEATSTTQKQEVHVCGTA